MRALLLVPLALIITAGIGWAVCTVAGFDIAPRDVLAAAIICLISGELAVVPLILTRGASQGAVSQAGLVATVLHLFLSIALAAVVLLGKWPPGIGRGFLFWLMGFYWVSLIVVVICSVRAVKSAPPDRAAATTDKQ